MFSVSMSPLIPKILSLAERVGCHGPAGTHPSIWHETAGGDGTWARPPCWMAKDLPPVGQLRTAWTRFDSPVCQLHPFEILVCCICTYVFQQVLGLGLRSCVQKRLLTGTQVGCSFGEHGWCHCAQVSHIFWVRGRGLLYLPKE